MRLLITIILFCSIAVTKLQGQNLLPVGNGIPTSYGIYSGTVVFNNEIYAADNLQIYKWDGTVWQSLGIVVDQGILCMTVYNNELYVGGWFESFNGLPVNRIVRYDGNTWQSLGTGILVTNNVVGGVEKMIEYNGSLIVLGAFIQAGNISVNQIASWNGTVWDSLGSGITGLASIPSMCIYNNELCVFSQITNAGGIPVTNAAKWNGTAWTSMGSGITAWPVSSTVYNNEVYVGLWLGAGNNRSMIVKWDGTVWANVEQNLNSAMMNVVMDMKVFNGCLYAAGLIDTINGVQVGNVARYDGQNWSSVGNGVNGYANFFTQMNSDLYMTGDFSNSGSVVVNHVVKFDSTPVCLTSMAEVNSNDQSLQIFPNPASDLIYIQSLNNDHSNCRFEIYNSLGQLMDQGNINSGELDIRTLRSGYYQIRFIGNGFQETKMLIKI